MSSAEPGHIWRTKARSRTTTTSSPRRMGLRPLIIVRDGDRKNPRAVQPLHPSRHDALPLGQGQRQIVPMPLPRLELPQHRQAARRAVAGRLRRRHARSEIQYRPGAARRVLSRLHLRHAQSRRAAADRASRSDRARSIDEWLDRNPGGKVVVCEANRFRYKGNWKLAYDNSCDGYHVAYSHRSLLGNREPLRRRECQGHGVLSQLARHAADVHALHRPRQPLQGQAAESRETAGRAVGAGKRASRHGALRSRIHRGAMATAPSRFSTSPAPSPSTSTCFRTSRCSATTSRCSSRSASRRPTRSGTAP